MRESAGPRLEELEEMELPLAELRLLVEPEPRSRVFVQNLRGLFQRPKLDLLNLKSARRFLA